MIVDTITIGLKRRRLPLARGMKDMVQPQGAEISRIDAVTSFCRVVSLRLWLAVDREDFPQIIAFQLSFSRDMIVALYR